MCNIDKAAHIIFGISYLILMSYLQDNYFEVSSRIERKTESSPDIEGTRGGKRPVPGRPPGIRPRARWQPGRNGDGLGPSSNGH